MNTFCEATGNHFGFVVMSALGFKARVDPLPKSASLPVYNRFLRITSGATPTDLLANITAEPF